MGQPLIAVTVGDPAGIGPEVTLKAVRELRGAFDPVLVGSRAILEWTAKHLDLDFHFRDWNEGDCSEESIPVCNVPAPEPPIQFGQVRQEYGLFVWDTIRTAVSMAKGNKVDAIVTAPLNKHALKLAGCPHSGHTELLAQLAGIDTPVMMLANSRLKVALLTTHIPLANVASSISIRKIIRTCQVIFETFSRFGWGDPRVGVLGLNPHAGEEGELGTEEIDVIAPGLELCQNSGRSVVGPIPADTAFHRALNGEFDLLLAMYHDQGIGPLKTISFEEVVNITLGLPFIRVSPGHGTAFDIAGQGVADPNSMICALKTAIELCGDR